MAFYSKLKKYKGIDEAAQAKRLRVVTHLLKLRAAMSQHLKTSGSGSGCGHSVRIATWNLREFGGNKYGGRDFECLFYIAEIISNFDIVALQEIRDDLSEFQKLLRILGHEWDYLATDVTQGRAGNSERMVFLFNQSKVSFRNIAGELTLEEGAKVMAAYGERIKLENGSKIKLPEGAKSLSGVYKARLQTAKDGHKQLDDDLEIDLPAGATLELPEGSRLAIVANTPVVSPGTGRAEVTIPQPISGPEYRLRFPEKTFDDSQRQFARTPYLLAFQSGWLKVTLCTVHIYYGDKDDADKLEQRRSEIEHLVKALDNKAENEFKHDDEAFLGILGDFNIEGKNHPTMSALTNSNFVIHEKLQSIPGSNVAKDKTYDQIAFWKPTQEKRYSRLNIVAANVFDFYEVIFTMEDETIYRAEPNTSLKKSTLYKAWRTYKMSDHLPMWVEVETDFGEAYLEHLKSELSS